MKLKKCTSCGGIFPEEFFTSKSGKCKVCRRNEKWLERYNMHPDEYLAKLEEQNYKCEICGCELQHNYLCVDHDHKTGKVRGLLCPQCNRGLGLLQDNYDYLIQGALYLDKYKDKK